MNEGNVCLVDYATTHIIIRDKIYFVNLTLKNANVSTLSGTTNLIKGSERVSIMLPNGTRFHSKSTRNLLNFKDIRKNGYHIETMNEGSKELFILPLLFMVRNL